MREVKYLALGDSYTVGESVTEEERFPAHTKKLLRAEDIDVSVKYIAATGWTSADLTFNLTLQNPANDFDIVTLLIGVNDQYQKRPKDQYKLQFSALLSKAVELVGNRKERVFVLSIPDYSITPYVTETDKLRVSTEIDEFNAINRGVTLRNGITYIDITASSRRARNDTTLIASDDLHPSGKEYESWASMLMPLIKKVL